MCVAAAAVAAAARSSEVFGRNNTSSSKTVTASGFGVFSAASYGYTPSEVGREMSTALIRRCASPVSGSRTSDKHTLKAFTERRPTYKAAAGYRGVRAFSGYSFHGLAGGG